MVRRYTNKRRLTEGLCAGLNKHFCSETKKCNENSKECFCGFCKKHKDNYLQRLNIAHIPDIKTSHFINSIFLTE